MGRLGLQPLIERHGFALRLVEHLVVHVEDTPSASHTHSTRRRLPSGISRSSVPCSTSSGAVNAGARRGSPTCSSARPNPGG